MRKESYSMIVRLATVASTMLGDRGGASAQHLANLFGVSKRTVQADRAYLRDHLGAQCVQDRAGHVRIINAEELAEKLALYLNRPLCLFLLSAIRAYRLRRIGMTAPDGEEVLREEAA